jgi:ABC-type branched-subunit amino acid transport system substrate-binding protein
MLRRIGRFAGLCVCTIGVAGAAGAQGLPNTIKTAAMITVSGPAAGGFFAGLVAIKMAVKDINDAGGIAGKPVDLIIADTQFPNTTQAVAEARRVAEQEKVHLVMGPQTTQEALAVAPILTEAKLLYVTTAASSAFNATVAPTGFSTYLSSPAYSKAMIDYAAKVMKAKSIAVITDTGGQSKDAVLIFHKLAPEAGLTISGEQTHEPAVTDVTAQLLALRRSNPEALLQVSSSGPDAGIIFKNLNDLGWEVPVVSQVAATVSNQVIKSAGFNVFKSGRIAAVQYGTFTYCPGDPVGGAPFTKWVERLKAFDPQNFDNVPKYSISFTYDGMILAKQAIEATKSVDGMVLAKWIEQNAASFNGASGRMSNPEAPSHHLFSADAIAMTSRPDDPRSDWLTLRAGC